MERPFGLYPRFYVKKKEQLFPVIEKYTGNKIASGTPHGKIIPVYFRLLRTNQAFRADIDALIAQKESYNNAISDWRILNVFRSEENKVPDSNGLFGGIPEKTLSGGGSLESTGSGLSGGSGFFGGIMGAIGGIAGYAAESKAAQAQSDAAFMEIVLNEQKQNDTMKILVITGVTLAFVGLGVYFVLKTRK